MLTSLWHIHRCCMDADPANSKACQPLVRIFSRMVPHLALQLQGCKGNWSHNVCRMWSSLIKTTSWYCNSCLFWSKIWNLELCLTCYIVCRTDHFDKWSWQDWGPGNGPKMISCSAMEDCAEISPHRKMAHVHAHGWKTHLWSSDVHVITPYNIHMKTVAIDKACLVCNCSFYFMREGDTHTSTWKHGVHNLAAVYATHDEKMYLDVMELIYGEIGTSCQCPRAAHKHGCYLSERDQ